ncbi:hypothetical protein [Rhizobium leguminosarum]|uniref:hypothetical protein n=1 Tax=Rhizobium leguminosarum TaxID=384 RepID=UPI002E12F25B|nr:hypothetical protein U8Q02_43655 [Rhizobium leguminosarum]
MPSLNDLRRLLKRLDFETSQISGIEAEIVAERALRREAIVATVRAEAANLFDNALPASDARLSALERRRSDLARRFASIREEHWDLRRGVIRGNFKDKLAEVVVEHCRAALPKHRQAISNWNGHSVSDLLDLYLDYFADCMAISIPHAEAVSDLSGLFVLDGQAIPLPELFFAEADPCVASDEDGNMLQIRQWSVRVVPLDKIEAVDGSKDELLERVAQMQEILLEPVLADVMRCVRENGGAGTWFRSEMLAIEAFRPEWHYRSSLLATHLANALFFELGAASGRIDRGLAETGLIENPYVRIDGRRALSAPKPLAS